MSDIELVIRISEKTINEIKNNAMFDVCISSDIRWDVTSAIENSIPLPKGHGRLIDADALVYKQTHHGNYYTPFELIDENDLNRAQTIIEADREV